jgi:ABC-2 type transport system permease protein
MVTSQKEAKALSNVRISNRGFFKYTNLLRELVVRDIKIRYRRSLLGILWTVLSPLLNMLVMTVVFQTIFASEIEFFALYVMIGNIVFGFVSEATNRGMNAILWNASLIKKVYIPKYLFPLANVLSSMVNFGFSYVAMIFVMIIIGAPFSWMMLASIVPFIYLIVFSYGLSLLLCALNVFFRDTQHLYSVFLTAWMYVSAIFYSVEALEKNPVSAPVAKFINLNPLYQYIRYFREIIMDGSFPGIIHNLSCLGCAIAMLIIGGITFKLTQKKFILHI